VCGINDSGHTCDEYLVLLAKSGMTIPLLCDNESVMKIATNPVQHKRIKHIDIRHQFLRDHVSKCDIVMKGVRTDDQLVEIITKPLDETHFCKLRSELNVIDLSNVA
jgi:hypothetical protein